MLCLLVLICCQRCCGYLLQRNADLSLNSNTTLYNIAIYVIDVVDDILSVILSIERSGEVIVSLRSIGSKSGYTVTIYKKGPTAMQQE